MGFPWLSWTGNNHGGPSVSPLIVISHANFAGLLGILRTQKILVGSHAHFGTFFKKGGIA